jgi:hypothetical protein
VKIDARKILRHAANAESRTGDGINVAVLAKLAKCTPANVYLNLKKVPVPIWLLKTFKQWHEQNGPLFPTHADRLFRWYCAKAWPRCPFEVSRGRPSKDDDGDKLPSDPPPKPPKGGKSKPEPGSDAEHATTKLETNAPRQGAAAQLEGGGNGEGKDGERQDANGSGEIEPDSNGRIGGLRQPASGKRDADGAADNDELPEGEAGGDRRRESTGILPHGSNRARVARSNTSLARLPHGTSEHAGHTIDGTEARRLGKTEAAVYKQDPGTIDADTLKPDFQRLFAGTDFSSEESVAKLIRRTEAQQPAGICAIRTEIIKRCVEPRQPWVKWKGSPENVRRKIFDHFHVNIRERKASEKCARRDAAIVEVFSGPVSQHRRDSHDKGAGEYSMGSLRHVVQGVMRAPAIEQAIADHPDLAGCHLSDSVIERALRVRRGGADAHVEYRDHLERCIGFKAQYAGQVAVVDATGYPVQFAYGDNREKHKRWIYLLCDVASARVVASENSATSESEGWRPKDDPGRLDVMLQFARRLGYWPEWLINDAISTLTANLRYLKPGDHPLAYLSDGVLLWFAGGTRPYVRMAGRPEGGAHVERAVRTVKDKLVELGTRRAVQKEAEGAGLKRLTQCQSEVEFHAQLAQGLAELNASQLKRRGCPLNRDELYAQASGEQGRSEHLQTPGLWEADDEGYVPWRVIVNACKTGTILRGRVNITLNGKAWTAQIDRPQDAEFSIEEKTALILPPGAAKDDDSEAFRVLVIAAEGARVQYHPAIARSIQVDEYWQDKSYPIIGAFRALPEGAADKHARNREADAGAYRRRVEAARKKEGTTGQYV